MSPEKKTLLDVEFDPDGEFPTLYVFTYNVDGIRKLVEIMMDLATGATASVAVHELEYLQMGFPGDLWLKAMKHRRFAVNVDQSIDKKGGRLQVLWRASPDEWVDSADRVRELAERPILGGHQYMSGAASSIEVVVEYHGGE